MRARSRQQSAVTTESASGSDLRTMGEPSTVLTDASSPGNALSDSDDRSATAAPVKVPSPAGRRQSWQTSVSRERLFWLGVFLVGVLLLLNGVAGIVLFIARQQVDSEPLDCLYGWHPWGACSRCYASRLHRVRRVNITRHPLNGGLACPGEDSTESAVCSTIRNCTS